MCSVLQSGLSSSCFDFKCNIFLFLSLLCYSSSTEQFVLETLSHNPTLFNFNGTLGSCSVPEIKGNNLFEMIIILPSSKNALESCDFNYYFRPHLQSLQSALCFLSQAGGQVTPACVGCFRAWATCKQVQSRFLIQVTFFQAQRIQKASNQNLPSSPVV